MCPEQLCSPFSPRWWFAPLHQHGIGLPLAVKSPICSCGLSGQFGLLKMAHERGTLNLATWRISPHLCWKTGSIRVIIDVHEYLPFIWFVCIPIDFPLEHNWFFKGPVCKIVCWIGVNKREIHNTIKMWFSVPFAGIMPCHLALNKNLKSYIYIYTFITVYCVYNRSDGFHWHYSLSGLNIQSKCYIYKVKASSNIFGRVVCVPNLSL